MNAGHHIIMRQIMELETPSPESAFNLQNRVGRFCRDELPALLDRICSRCDDGDHVFRIDRLEIDLGRISSLHPEEDIREGTSRIFPEVLADIVDRLRLQEAPMIAAGGPQPSIRGSPLTSPAGSPNRVLSAVDTDLERILHFLEKGYLPWSTIAGAVKPLEEQLKQLMQTAPDSIAAILKYIADRPVARRRLVVQSDEDLLRALIRQETLDGGARLERWERDFKAAAAVTDFDQSVLIELRTNFWDSAFRYFPIASNKKITAQVFWQRTILKTAERSGRNAGELLTGLLQSARQVGDRSVVGQRNLADTLARLSAHQDFAKGRLRADSGAPRPYVLPAPGSVPVDISDGAPVPASAVVPQPNTDRQANEKPRPGDLLDLPDKAAGRHSVVTTPPVRVTDVDLKGDSELPSNVTETRDAPELQGDDWNDRGHAENAFRRAEQADGAVPDNWTLPDGNDPRIRFEIQLEQATRTAAEQGKTAGVYPTAAKQAPQVDPPSSIPSSDRGGPSATGGDPEVAFKQPGLPDSAPEDTDLTRPAPTKPSAEDFAPGAHGGVPEQGGKGPEGASKPAAADRARRNPPETVIAAGVSTPEKIAPAYLSGIDAETALQEIYVDNAGLVILWPFLAHFFKTLELMPGGNLTDDRSRARAIYILQYLATGKEEFPEYVLPLNKFLCGWDIGEPIGREYRLKASEKAESQNLLEAVIRHWSALKQTSVDGLRTSFLQRNGVLIETMRHWLLRVERKPHDMLLERLPWGMSMIRLSWVEKMLTVEW